MTSVWTSTISFWNSNNYLITNTHKTTFYGRIIKIVHLTFIKISNIFLTTVKVGKNSNV